MGKTIKETTRQPARSPRPRRAAQKNRFFLDSKVWHNESVSSVSSVSAKASNKVQKRSNLSNESTQPNSLMENSPSLRNPKEPAANDGRKSKKFIRFRFQIDCSAANDISVDELVQFLKSNMKVDGKRDNLNEVTIDRRNAHIDILAKINLKKKYLKQLSKQFLKKKKLSNFHVIAKNKRAYKIVLKSKRLEAQQ